jgi:hypothetical protein
MVWGMARVVGLQPGYCTDVRIIIASLGSVTCMMYLTPGDELQPLSSCYAVPHCYFVIISWPHVMQVGTALNIMIIC